MPYETIDQPMTADQAFRGEGDRAYQSQAAVLLALGALMHFAEDEVARPEVAAENGSGDELPPEDLETLGIPPAVRRIGSDRGVRYSTAFVRESMRREGMKVPEPSVSTGTEVDAGLREAMPTLAERLLEDPTPLTAVQLCAAALASPDDLVRVAAATAHAEMTLREEQAGLREVLARATYSEDALVRGIALTGLSRIAPRHPRVLEASVTMGSQGEPGRSRTSLLVHGTFANGNAWWRPGGDFHAYAVGQVDPHLYAGTDWLGWSGGYSDAARALGAIDLMAFVTSKGFDGLDLFTHSHGGSVAFLATRGGMNIGRLVVLSCPVHRHKYWPDWSHVGRTVSIRVHMDLVLLADFAGQRFHDPAVEEIVLPIWFKHSATHDPAVWTAHHLPSRI